MDPKVGDDLRWMEWEDFEVEVPSITDTDSKITSRNNSLSAHRSSEWEIIFMIRHIRQEYLETSLSVVCILGNCLVLLVLSTQKKKLSLHVYMISLAVCDLTAGILIAFHSFSHVCAAFSMTARHLIYALEEYKIYGVVAVTMAANILALMLTVDRYIAVRFSLHWKIWCTTTRATILSVAIIVFSLCINIHFIFQLRSTWAFRPDLNDTFPYVRYTDFGSWPSVKSFTNVSEIFLRFLLPFIGMIVFNVQLLRLLKDKHRILQKINSTGSINSIKGSTQRVVRTSQDFLGLTFAVTVCFILTHFCAIVACSGALIRGSQLEDTFSLKALFLFARVLQFINSCVNFFLYLIFCKGFRQKFIGGVRSILAAGKALLIKAIQKCKNGSLQAT